MPTDRKQPDKQREYNRPTTITTIAMATVMIARRNQIKLLHKLDEYFMIFTVTILKWNDSIL